MKVTILDDYLDTLRTLACFRGADGHDVTVGPTTRTTSTSSRRVLHDTEAVVLIRERTALPGALVERSPASG